MPTPLADAAFIHHDDAVLHTVSKLIAPTDPLFRTPTESDLRDDFTSQHQRHARLQLQLPVKQGGCGITSSTTTAPIAYVAAWRGCLSFLRKALPTSQVRGRWSSTDRGASSRAGWRRRVGTRRRGLQPDVTLLDSSRHLPVIVSPWKVAGALTRQPAACWPSHHPTHPYLPPDSYPPPPGTIAATISATILTTISSTI